MARHNIYIRQENEEAWQQSEKSDMINDLLEKSRGRYPAEVAEIIEPTYEDLEEAQHDNR